MTACFDCSSQLQGIRGRQVSSASRNALRHPRSQPFTSQCVRSLRQRQTLRRMKLTCDSQTASIPSVSTKKRVTLVRHGQSTWNEEGRIQGSSDFSILTSKGEAQAETTRKMLQGKHFDVGFRSPLARASRTAEIIWSSRCTQLIDLWELREIDLYSFQGLRKEEGKDKYGDAYIAWKQDPANFEIDDKFPVRELWERGAECWEAVLQADGTDILVVAHNAVNQSMVANCLGLGPKYFRRLTQSNCGLTTFEFTPSGGTEPAVILEHLNQTPSLPFKGNEDKARNLAVLISSSGNLDGNQDEIASAISNILGDEHTARFSCDKFESSTALAHDVAALLEREIPTRWSGSLPELFDNLLIPGTSVMFAQSQTINDIVTHVLQRDKHFGSRLKFSRGGITVVDFVCGGVENATIACLNNTAHLSDSQ